MNCFAKENEIEKTMTYIYILSIRNLPQNEPVGHCARLHCIGLLHVPYKRCVCVPIHIEGWPHARGERADTQDPTLAEACK